MATTINSGTFFGFPAGSVLFLEASASGDLYSVVPVTFDFQMRPNFKFTQGGTDILVDAAEDDVSKMFDSYHDPFFGDSTSTTDFPGNAHSGWTTVDYRYMPDVDPTAKMTLQTPFLRLVHQQYLTSNFNKFNL